MQFVNPALLGLLGLISIPIIIHLLNRRRFQVVRWAPMEFLLQAQKENKKRIRLEHLLVLLLRILAIALLVMLVSRPVSTSAGMGLIGLTQPIERVIVLDDSGSMAYRSGRATSYQRAREAVKKLLKDLQSKRPRDLVTCVRASHPQAPDLRLASPGNAEQIDRFLTILEQSRPSQRGMELTELLETALTRKEEGADAPERRVVYVITDLRRRDWVGARGETPKQIGDVIRKHQGEVDPEEQDRKLRLLVVDVGGEGRRNVGVTSIAPKEKLAMAGLPLELVIKVKNYGKDEVRSIPLFLESGQGRAPLPPIDKLAPGQEVTVTSTYTFLESGARGLTVKLSEDDLPLDDRRHMALQVQDRLKALLVNGEEGAGALGDETALLELALAPGDDALSGVEPTVVLPQALGEEDLSGFASLVVCNLGEWREERVEAVESFVRRGGGLAIFLGDNVVAKNYEKALYRDGKGLLPCRLGKKLHAVDVDDRVRLAPAPTNHPLTAVFQGENNPFLRRVSARIRMSCPVDPKLDSGSEVVLHFDDDPKTPFAIVKTFGRGKVVLFNTTADRQWSNWPGNPTFLITAHKLVRLLASSATEGRNIRCGEPLLKAINPARYWPTAKLVAPDGKGGQETRELHAEARADDDEGDAAGKKKKSSALWFRYPETDQAGIYELTTQTQTNESRVEYFAANLDASEGDLTRADPAQILPGLEEVQALFVRPDSAGDLLAHTDGTRSELWRAILLALALVLVCEQALAWRAARHRRPVGGETA